MNLFVLIPGFGPPHWDAKVDILRQNLATVESYFTEFVFYIIQYDTDRALPEDLLENEHIEVIYDRGILGRNIHVHAHPDMIDAYNPDYIMILLDDVELQAPFDWYRMLEIQKKLELDIVSPVLANPETTSWNFMGRAEDPCIVASVTTRCELFCYVMTPDAYDTYYRYCDPKNPWMWGMDFMLASHMKLRVGLLHELSMMHHFARVQDTHDPNHPPSKDGELYLAKHNTSWDELTTLPTVLQVATATLRQDQATD